jgi:hypothetical protein
MRPIGISSPSTDLNRASAKAPSPINSSGKPTHQARTRMPALLPSCYSVVGISSSHQTQGWSYKQPSDFKFVSFWFLGPHSRWASTSLRNSLYSASLPLLRAQSPLTMSWPRVKRDDALGRFCKTVRRIYAFMLIFLDGRTRPLRPRVDSTWIGTDVRVRKQSHSVLVQGNALAIRRQYTWRQHYAATNRERALNELTTSDRRE